MLWDMLSATSYMMFRAGLQYVCSDVYMNVWKNGGFIKVI